MLDYLIVGGGVHGTHLSLYLTQRLRVNPERLRVLDPYEAPLARWDANVANVGMNYLRSAHAHNLHYDPFSLITFARTRRGQPLARFTDPYGRPSAELFRAHSQHLIQRHHLQALRITGRARGLARYSNGWRVETELGSLEAHRIILAMGLTEQPYWPDWAQTLRAAGAPIHHVFDPAFNRESLSDWTHAVVVGGGITAAQTAMALSRRAPVTLLMRHPARVHDFDADPCWVTSLCLRDFHAEPDTTRRRAMIQAARHRGSMPPDVARSLQQAALTGAIHRRLAAVERASITSVSPPLYEVERGLGGEDSFSTRPEREGSGVRLHLADSTTLETDLVILATGFESARPGGAWLDKAIADHGLPCAPDGYPVVDKTLCWQPGLYVTGPLAELEIGPTARNIIGARLASERLAALPT